MINLEIMNLVVFSLKSCTYILKNTKYKGNLKFRVKQKLGLRVLKVLPINVGQTILRQEAAQN